MSALKIHVLVAGAREKFSRRSGAFYCLVVKVGENGRNSKAKATLCFHYIFIIHDEVFVVKVVSYVQLWASEQFFGAKKGRKGIMCHRETEIAAHITRINWRRIENLGENSLGIGFVLGIEKNRRR